MSINLNNVQFRKFVSFADNADSYNAIAQVGDVSPGQDDISAPGALLNRQIVAKKQFDWVGNALRLSRSRSTNNAARELFVNTILKMCNASSVDQLPEGVRNALSMKDYGKGKPLTARRILAVSEALKAEVAKKAEAEAVFAGPLGLNGKSGGKIAGICVPGSGLAEAEDPKAELQRRMNKIGREYLYKTTLDGIFGKLGKEIVFKDPDVPNRDFDLDFLRGTAVKIGGETYTSPKGASAEEKAKTLEKVHDAFVRFITGDPNAKFETASRAVKTQANVLMGFACQGLDSVVMTGVSYGFDANCSSGRFSCTGLGERVQTYEFSKDEDGNVKYSYFLGMKNIMLHTTDENGKNTTNRDADGVMEYKMDVGFSSNELERYCKIDWEHVDRGPVTETNEITRKMQGNWLEDLANALPEDQKMQFNDVNISFNFNSDKFDD